jgi:hypothetical protein
LIENYFEYTPGLIVDSLMYVIGCDTLGELAVEAMSVNERGRRLSPVMDVNCTDGRNNNV